jgi:hypothetical protein
MNEKVAPINMLCSFRDALNNPSNGKTNKPRYAASLINREPVVFQSLSGT